MPASGTKCVARRERRVGGRGGNGDRWRCARERRARERTGRDDHGPAVQPSFVGPENVSHPDNPVAPGAEPVQPGQLSNRIARRPFRRIEWRPPASGERGKAGGRRQQIVRCRVVDHGIDEVVAVPGVFEEAGRPDEIGAVAVRRPQEHTQVSDPRVLEVVDAKIQIGNLEVVSDRERAGHAPGITVGNRQSRTVRLRERHRGARARGQSHAPRERRRGRAERARDLERQRDRLAARETRPRPEQERIPRRHAPGRNGGVGGRAVEDRDARRRTRERRRRTGHAHRRPAPRVRELHGQANGLARIDRAVVVAEAVVDGDGGHIELGHLRRRREAHVTEIEKARGTERRDRPVAQPAIGKALPDPALVRAPVRCAIRIEQRITRVDEAGIVRRQLERVGHELQHRLVAFRHLAVRARGVGDDAAAHLPQGHRPDLADVVDLERASQLGFQRTDRNAARVVRRHIVHVRPGERVDGVVGRVWKAPDAIGVVVGVVEEGTTETVRRVSAGRVRAVRVVALRVVQQRERVEVAPSLAQPSADAEEQPGGVAHEPVRQAVGQLVDDDLGIEGTVPIGIPVDEAKHLHAPGCSVGRRRKRGVVAACVLHIGAHGVATQAQPAEIDGLEVPGRLVESEVEEPIVVPVRDVEELRCGTAPKRVLHGTGARRVVAGVRITAERRRRVVEVARTGPEKIPPSVPLAAVSRGKAEQTPRNRPGGERDIIGAAAR